MRIALIGNFAPDRQESMLRFARLLATGLEARGHRAELWAPEPRLVRWLPRYRYDGVAKLVGYVDKYVLFPRQVRARLARERPADVAHIVDHANAVYAPLFAGRPLLVTCHDLLQIRAARGEFPQHRVSALGRRQQGWILRHIRRLPHVVSDSAATGEDLQRLAGLPAGRITVIPAGLNFPFRPLAPAEAQPLIDRLLVERQLSPGLLGPGGAGYLLNVGGGQWYKNRAGLLAIYHELRRRLAPAPRLVMVGKPLAPPLTAQARQLGLADHLIHLSGVSETQLQALYSLAAALIFPSWHEGFGWPIAEAHACGCPVFTSERPPMTEVGGDAAGYFDPAAPPAAAARIAEVWPRRAELAARGRVRAAEWDPQRMIARYLDTYAGLIAGTPRARVA